MPFGTEESVFSTHNETMKTNEILIHLHNSVDAFTLKSRHIEQIQHALPDVRLTVAADNSDFMNRLPATECALVWIFKPEWYARAERLKAVFTPAAGRDWVAADPSGRVPTFHGSFHGRIMRESLLSMMLFFNRRLRNSLADQQDRTWGRLEYSECTGLFNQRVLIVGFGSLGVSMAELLKAFGATVIGVKQNLHIPMESHVADRVISFHNIEEELPKADHVVLLLPGGTETNDIFTARHFSLMKPGACLYNLGRGNCYREADLMDALDNGTLAGAGLDVFAEEPLPADSPLWEKHNVLITPHSSAISREYIDLFIEEWLGICRTEKVYSLLKGGEI